MISFEGKVALVTGASKGIGAATAKKLAALGARVAVHFNRDAAGAAAVVAASGSKSASFPADLSRWGAGEELVARVEAALAPIDVVVLNHGIWKGASIDRMTERDYDEMLDANLRGVFAVTGAVARRMKERGRGGSIVLVASTAGQRGEADHAHYAATKGAVISLTKSLAPELAAANVRVNCVAPGWVATSMTAATLDDPEQRARIFATIPLGRVGEPDEIAAAIAFVASDAASFITGEILNVNGGAVLCG